MKFLLPEPVSTLPPSKAAAAAEAAVARDKNRLISVAELHMVLKSLGEKCSLHDCSKMIKSFDVDGDGNVNFEEFKTMMTKGRAFAR